MQGYFHVHAGSIQDHEGAEPDGRYVKLQSTSRSGTTDERSTDLVVQKRGACLVLSCVGPSAGRIINNGSVSAQRPRPDSAPYTATKHALTGLTLSTSLDGRKYDIGCGQLDIGNATAVAAPDGFAQRPQAWRTDEEVPLMDEPTFTWDDCAHAVLYMASLPLSANVLQIQMTVMATKAPLAGRG